MLSLHVDTGTAWGGGPNQVMLTVTGLRAEGHRAVLAADPSAELFQRMSEGTDLVPLSSRADIDMSAAWNLSRILKQTRPDLVHAHEPRAMAIATLALSIAAPRPRPPFVVSNRTEIRLHHTSFGRWTASEVDAFVADSHVMADRLHADGIPRAKLHVIHEGVDVERIERLPAANLHADFYLPTHAPVVGTVGALIPRKALHHLIGAAAIAVRSVPDARFVIVGDGPLRSALERQIHEHHLERHIFLAGYRPDVIEAIKAFDVFALSSISEGMCTALVDAMACSRPSVVTDVGGIPEVAVDEDTAFIVPARDEGAMADRLIQLLKDESLRARMGRLAYARTLELFRVARMVSETLGVYERLLNSTARPGTARAAQGTL